MTTERNQEEYYWDNRAYLVAYGIYKCQLPDGTDVEAEVKLVAICPTEECAEAVLKRTGEEYYQEHPGHPRGLLHFAIYELPIMTK